MIKSNLGGVVAQKNIQQTFSIIQILTSVFLEKSILSADKMKRVFQKGKLRSHSMVGSQKLPQQDKIKPPQSTLTLKNHPPKKRRPT